MASEIRVLAVAVLAVAMAAGGCGLEGASTRVGGDGPRDCADCHGTAGISADLLVPNLAGQSADYLALQLGAFRERRKDPGAYWRFARRDPLMDHQAATLTDGRIQELSARFAAFSCLPAAAVGVAPPARLRRCDSCHGIDGASLRPWVPSLAGQKEAYLRDQMTLFRDVEVKPDKRLHPIMSRRGLELDDNEIAIFARYFSSFACAESR